MKKISKFLVVILVLCLRVNATTFINELNKNISVDVKCGQKSCMPQGKAQTLKPKEKLEIKDLISKVIIDGEAFEIYGVKPSVAVASAAAVVVKTNFVTFDFLQPKDCKILSTKNAGGETIYSGSQENHKLNSIICDLELKKDCTGPGQIRIGTIVSAGSKIYECDFCPMGKMPNKEHTACIAKK